MVSSTGQLNFPRPSLPSSRDMKFPRDRRMGGGFALQGLCSAFNYRYRMERSKKKKKTPQGFKTPVHTNQTPPRISVWNEAKQCSCNTLINAMYIFQHLCAPNLSHSSKCKISHYYSLPHPKQFPLWMPGGEL